LEGSQSGLCSVRQLHSHATTSPHPCMSRRPLLAATGRADGPFGMIIAESGYGPASGYVIRTRSVRAFSAASLQPENHNARGSALARHPPGNSAATLLPALLHSDSVAVAAGITIVAKAQSRWFSTYPAIRKAIYGSAQPPLAATAYAPCRRRGQPFAHGRAGVFTRARAGVSGPAGRVRG